MSERILLTGARGQVGFELRRALAPLGVVVAPPREAFDLDDPASLRARVRDAAPTVVVNAGAYTAVDRAESEPDAARRANAEAPGVLAEEAARLGACIVHFSTDYVFPGDAATPYVEDAATAPRNVYGRTKLEGERAVRAANPRHLIVRTSWVYAARGRNFLRTMLRVGAERAVVRVVADQRGAPTSARFLADATAAMLAETRRADAGRWGTYHVAAAGETTWHGFAEAIFAAVAAQGIRTPTVEPIATTDYPTPAARPAYSVLDCAHARATFGLHVPDWRAQLALVLEELGERCAEDGR